MDVIDCVTSGMRITWGEIVDRLIGVFELIWMACLVCLSPRQTKDIWPQLWWVEDGRIGFRDE